MIKFYSSGCPKCLVLESLMKKKSIEFDLINDEDIYLDIADKNKIMSMPFAEVNGEILDTKKLQNYIANL